LGVEAADVAEGGPALLAARSGGLVGVVAVLERAAVEVDEAVLPDRLLGPAGVEDVHGSRDAAADRAGVPQPVLGADDGHPVALAAGVVLPDHRAEPGDHRL